MHRKRWIALFAAYGMATAVQAQPVALPSAPPASAPASTVRPAPLPDLPATSRPVPATSAEAVIVPLPPAAPAPPANATAPALAASPARLPSLPIPPAPPATGDVLMAPVYLGSTSLFFTAHDLEVMGPFLEAYDASGQSQKGAGAAAGEDLTSLLGSIKTKEAAPAPNPLPNLYLASIVYYSPSHWSVWINDRKLVNRHNVPGGVFYVRRISRAEIELVWRPPSLLDTALLWKQLTENGKAPPAGIAVDEREGTITIRMRPNQTFLPRFLTLREGFVHANPNASALVRPAALPVGELSAPGSPSVAAGAGAPPTPPTTPGAPAATSAPPPAALAAAPASTAVPPAPASSPPPAGAGPAPSLPSSQSPAP